MFYFFGVDLFEKQDQKARDEMLSFKTRIQQLEINDFIRQQEYILQNQKNEKFEENMKHLIAKPQFFKTDLR